MPANVLKKIYEEDYLTDYSEEEWIRMCEGWCSEPGGVYRKVSALAEPLIDNNDPLMEIGCGIGCFLSEWQKKGYRTVGIDPGPRAARIARERYQLEIIEDYANERSLREWHGRCGGVFAFEVIEHVVSPREFIRQCAACLKPGGVIALSTPNFAMYEKLGRYYLDVDRQEHIQFFTPKTMETLLVYEGFEIVELSLTQSMLPGEILQKKLTPHVFQSPLWQIGRRFEATQRFKRFVLGFLNGRRTAGTGADGMNIMVVAKKGTV